MKKKIIISLILAMCCIIASIPASAGENSEQGSCNPCGPWIKICSGFYEAIPKEHPASSGGDCHYNLYIFSHEVWCEQCVEQRPGNYTHSHGEGDHTCGDVINNTTCELL